MKGRAVAIATALVATLLLAGCMDMVYRKPLGEDEAAKLVMDEIPKVTESINTMERRPGMVTLSATLIDNTKDPPMRMHQSAVWGTGGVVKAHLEFQASGQSLMLMEAGNETGNETGGSDPSPGDMGEMGDMNDMGEMPGMEEMNAQMEAMMSQQIDFKLTMYCTPDKLVLETKGEIYEARPAEDCESAKPGAGDEGSPVINLEGVEVLSVDVHLWEVDAVIRDSDGALIDVHLDDRGRLTSMRTHDGEDITMVVEASYGDRKAIDVPATSADKRVAADVEWEQEDVGTMMAPIHRYTITSNDETAGLDEFEVRVMEGFGPDAAMVAAFAMDGAQTSEAGYTFAMMDADEDGLLSAGDIFTISQAPAQEGEFPTSFHITLWDTWANAEVGSFQIPAPGAAVLLLGLVLVGAVYRRRQ